jgi:hypothetical protein
MLTMRLFASMDKAFDFIEPFDSIIRVNPAKEPWR